MRFLLNWMRTLDKSYVYHWLMCVSPMESQVPLSFFGDSEHPRGIYVHEKINNWKLPCFCHSQSQTDVIFSALFGWENFTWKFNGNMTLIRDIKRNVKEIWQLCVVDYIHWHFLMQLLWPFCLTSYFKWKIKRWNFFLV